MSTETGGPSSEEMEISEDKLAKYQLTEDEHRFCTPTTKEENPYSHDLPKLFPEVDSFIASIQSQGLRDLVEKRVEYYRKNKGSSGDILTAIGHLIKIDVEGNFSKFSEDIRASAEFHALKNKYQRLSEAHSAGFAEIMAEASRGSREFEEGQEKRRQEEREKDSILPRLGVQGTFQTPGGAIRGVVERGAEVGGPYTINTPQGKVRVTKISKARYE